MDIEDNMENNKIVLELTPLLYYSTFDEDWFFKWLKKLKCVKDTQGILRSLYVTIQTPITKKEYWELKAMFRRYGHDINKLRVFKEHFKESDLMLKKPVEEQNV